VDGVGPGNYPRDGARQHCGFPAFRNPSDVSTDTFDTRNDSWSFRKRTAAALARLKRTKANGLQPGLDPNRLFLRRFTMKFHPLHDRILIKRIEEKETAKGGIIIPDSAKEKQQEGEVIAVGNGKKTEDGKIIPLDVKAGDRILFGKYSGTEIKIDNEDFLILKEEEVLGVIEGKAATAGKK
jgi:chaperonin GroES